MITLSAVFIGMVAALVVGLSKTALPGAALLATPLIALVFDGREIAGATLPILLLADVFAVRWYRDSARWDLLRPLVPWVGIGFLVGAAFFVAVGAGGRTLDVVIGVTILAMVLLQVVRMVQRSEPASPSVMAAAGFGSTGGFTTFVSNTAGPIMNTYMLRLGLGKAELMGTSAWFYFAVNVAKIPIYVILGVVASGGSFFTRESLFFDLLCAPAVLVGALGGRALFHKLPQQAFLLIVLVLSAATSVKLLAG